MFKLYWSTFCSSTRFRNLPAIFESMGYFSNSLLKLEVWLAINTTISHWPGDSGTSDIDVMCVCLKLTVLCYNTGMCKERSWIIGGGN